MSFYERFELLELVRDDGIKTFAARDVASGRSVLVHLFVNPGSADSQAVLAQSHRLPEQEQPRVVDRGQNDGTPYLVTAPLPEFAGLREWLAAKCPVAAPPASAPESPRLNVAGAWRIPAPPPPPPQKVAGPDQNLDQQFANLFETSDRVLPSPPRSPVVSAPPPPFQPAVEKTQQFPVAPAPPPAPAPAPVASPAPDPTPGEFTRMFQAPSSKPAEAKTPAANPPGEFTRMFQAPPASSPAPATAEPLSKPAPSKPASAPGEFTQMFQSPAAPPVAAAPPVKPPGEFTQMLQSPVRRSTPEPIAAPAPSKPSPSQPGEFTQFFQSPMSPGPLPQSPAAQKPGPAAPVPQPLGNSGHNRVGEFTRVFGPKDMPSAQAPSTPVSPQNISPQNIGGATQSFATPQAPAPRPTSPQGPGEYTQMFAAPAPLTLGQAPALAPAPASARSRLPLYLTLGAAAVLLIALILVLVFRK